MAWPFIIFCGAFHAWVLWILIPSIFHLFPSEWQFRLYADRRSNLHLWISVFDLQPRWWGQTDVFYTQRAGHSKSAWLVSWGWYTAAQYALIAWRVRSLADGMQECVGWCLVDIRCSRLGGLDFHCIMAAASRIIRFLLTLNVIMLLIGLSIYMLQLQQLS